MTKVLFVCLGNICRSPMAEAIFRDMIEKRGLAERFQIDSAGIGGWHVGERPHQGTLAVLSQYGIAHEGIVGRQIQSSDLQAFDYVIAMDEQNLIDLQKLGAEPGPTVFRLLDRVNDQKDKNVPDPYYIGNFGEVYNLLQTGCLYLLEHILHREHAN